MPEFSGAFDLSELATPTRNPQLGRRLLYVKSDGNLYAKNSAGTETLLSTAGGVPSTRNLSTGDGLIGGGNLAADRTFSVDFAASGVSSSVRAVRADDKRLTVLTDRAVCSASLTLTTTPQVLTGAEVLMFSSATTDVFEVTAFTDMQATTGAAGLIGIGGLQVDSVNQAGQIIFGMPTTGCRGTVGQTWKITGLSVATHSFRLIGYKATNVGGATMNTTHSSIAVTRSYG